MDATRRVLIIDHSKVVRSALAKHLHGHYDVREEQDGESAWQTLVLDPTIIAVVAGAHLARLNGYELLTRLRSSKIRRICDIPFLLVVSGSESEEDRQLAKERGVTDFITRSMKRQEVIDSIGRLGNWDPTLSLTNANIAELGSAPAEIAATAPRQTVQKTTALPPGVLSDDAIAAYLDSCLLEAQSQQKQISVLRFGLDDHAELTERFGNEVTQTIAARVARVLKDKIGQGDHIGCENSSRFVIVSVDSSHASCTAFARRVCRGLANSQVTIAGEICNLKVSAGIVSTTPDEDTTADALISLAEERLGKALRKGGCRVVSDDIDPGAHLDAQYFTDLAGYFCPQTATLKLGSAGLHLIPLLKMLDQEFNFGLPLSELERRLEARAKEEQAIS
ncbi:MAG: diguanylate cyclase [Zoogloeaceae bacterium]|nr:diguanylate cyclase [Zoogloeaceae bacterium]